MTSQQQIDRLMMPRYKVIADWPTSQFLVGDIFTFQKTEDIVPDDKEGEIWWDEKKGVFMHTVEKYPHLFKKLQWWEHREESEMPKYIQYGDKAVYRVYNWDFKENYGIGVKGEDYPLYLLPNVHPVTETDYLSYINKGK